MPKVPTDTTEYHTVDPHEIVFQGDDRTSFVRIVVDAIECKAGRMHEPHRLLVSVEIFVDDTVLRVRETFSDEIVGMPTVLRESLRLLRTGESVDAVLPTEHLRATVSESQHRVRTGLILEGQVESWRVPTWPDDVAEHLLFTEPAISELRFAFRLRDPTYLNEPIEQLDALFQYFSWFSPDR